MRYEYAFDLQRIAEDISRRMFPHIRIDRIKCFRSYGSSSHRTIARCHALGKLMQLAMTVDAFYALEFLSEQFDKLSDVEKVKTIIHELMHIPETFGGGFKQHHIVTEEHVNRCYKSYMYLRQRGESLDWFKLQKKKR
jgi:predicted metallopeptidase